MHGEMEARWEDWYMKDRGKRGHVCCARQGTQRGRDLRTTAQSGISFRESRPVQLEAGLQETTSGRAHKGFVQGLRYTRAEWGLKENPAPG